MNIFKKILTFLKNLFKGSSNVESESKGSAIPSPLPKNPPEKGSPTETSKDPFGQVASGKDSHGNTVYEPKKSNPAGTLEDFLWKPKADHDPNVVLIVGCTSIRSKDLQVEVLGKSGTPLSVGIRMTGRANGNRVHYRLDRTAKSFKKSAPLRVRFYQMVKGKKVIVKLKGRESIKVTNPASRRQL